MESLKYLQVPFVYLIDQKYLPKGLNTLSILNSWENNNFLKRIKLN